MKKFTVSSVLCMVSACTFLLSSAQTFAAWQTQGDTVNNITMKSVKGQIVEEYEQNQVVYPDAVVDKIVQIKNTGNADALPRVKIEKVWGDGRDENGNLLINPDLSTDNIEIIYNTDEWFYNEDDGYFYYKGVLKSGETTSSLFDSFRINGENTGGDYKNKEADIIVNMEMVQADENGPSYWNTSFEELGITYTPQEPNMVTEVDFNGPDDGFAFEVNGGDLFANFKNLVPGESRSQIIEIANNWDYPVELFLWADYIVQAQATDETRELINQLLYKYAKIVITDEDGNVIYNGTVWGSPDVDSTSTDSMRYPYSLGIFEAHQIKRLNVSLYLDPQMDNEFQTLLGLIKWVFCAQGADSSSGTSTVTTTTSATVDNNNQTNTSTTTSATVDNNNQTNTSTSSPVDNNTQTFSRSTTDTVTTTTVTADTVTSTSTSEDNNVYTSSTTTDTVITTTVTADTVTSTSTSEDSNIHTSSTTTSATVDNNNQTNTSTTTSATIDNNNQTNTLTTTSATVDNNNQTNTLTMTSATVDNNNQTNTSTTTSATVDNNTQTTSRTKTNTVVTTTVTKAITGSSGNNNSGGKQGSPKTGDFNNVGKYGALAVVSFILTLVTYKKSRDDSES